MNVNPYNLDYLRKIIRGLQKENRNLREQLEKSNIPYPSNDVFSNDIIKTEKYDIDQGARINSRYIDRDAAINFFAMFWGRRDVFAKRAKNSNYYPQCDNRWNSDVCPKQKGEKQYCEDCQYICWTKLKPEIIVSHLIGYKDNGTDVIGVYPLLSGGTCRFLAFDFDNHDKGAEKDDFANTDEDWHDEVDALRMICKHNDIDALVERSRSGLGAHVGIFFKGPVPASIARNFGFLLLEKGSSAINMKSFKYYDRMYPAQKDNPVIFHNGEVAMEKDNGKEVGFQSFLGFSKENGRVVLVLSNEIARDDEDNDYATLLGYRVLLEE